GDRLRERVVVRPDRDRDGDRVRRAAGLDIEAEARAVARGGDGTGASTARRAGDEVEANLRAPAGRDADPLAGIAVEPDPLDAGRDRCLLLTRHAGIDHGAGVEPVAIPDEARERGAREERSRDEQLRLPRAVTVALRHGDGHDAERGQVVRELRGRSRVSVRVRHDGAEEEGGALEARAEDARRILASAAARLAVPLLALGDLRRHRDEVARQPHPDPARRVEQVDRVRRAVPGEGEDALVDGPERHLGALAAAGRVAYAQVDAGGVARAVLGPL